MSMGMTNLINFDLFFLRKNENTFLTNYEYDKNISLSFDTGEVRQGGQGVRFPSQAYRHVNYEICLKSAYEINKLKSI